MSGMVLIWTPEFLPPHSTVTVVHTLAFGFTPTQVTQKETTTRPRCMLDAASDTDLARGDPLER